MARRSTRSGEEADTAALARLGILHSRRGRPDLAVPELEEVTKKDPAQLDAKAELGFLYLRGGDKEKAVKVLGDVVAVEPGHAYGLLYLGHTLYQLGKPKEAEQSFRGNPLTPSLSRWERTWGEGLPERPVLKTDTAAPG